jgi:hypothetical protein
VVFDAYLQQAKEQLIEEETPKANWSRCVYSKFI